jgi:aspartate carbamoyltransferase regulatory subunit
VIKEATKREADRLILSAKNKNKALWKIINKEIGNSHHVSNVIINTGVKIITNPQIITERFNIYFTEVIEDLLSQANYQCLEQYFSSR